MVGKICIRIWLILILLFTSCSSRQPKVIPVNNDGNCFAELRWCNLIPPETDDSIPLWFIDKKILHTSISHTYWLINDGQTDWIISARPTDMQGYGNLVVKTWLLTQSDTCKESQIAWKSEVSNEVCPQVKQMLRLAHDWPKDLPYHWWGPNCNSATRYLGEQTGFVPFAEPPLFPLAWGWNTPIEGLE